MSSTQIGNLRCPTCGGESFEANEERTYLKCVKCGREFLGGIDELKEYNLPEIEKQARTIVEDKLKSAFKKEFKK